MNLSLLLNSQSISFPTQTCLLLYCFCPSFPHLINMLLTVSSLSPYNLHFLFFCVSSIIALILLVLMVLFWAIIKRDLVSPLKFPLLSYAQVISYAILLACRLKYPYSCFSSYLCFLDSVVFLFDLKLLLYLAAVISLSFLFFVYSSSSCVVAFTQSSIQMSSFRPPFLNTESMSSNFLFFSQSV